ncbi:MAG: hypothetical protein WBQ94_03975 [Terracidiphilus sp.]
MKRVLLSWSSGKDSAWTLHVLRQQPNIEVVGLLTTVNTEFQRVAMHSTRLSVLEAQAEAAGVPLWIVPLPWPCSNEIYEARMAEACKRAVDEGVEAIAFGDLFLQDVRAYRETKLKPTGLEPLFPLWEIPTDALAREMITGGLRAKLTCVDPKQLPASFAGRDFDALLLNDLPPETDPCGERGEFHTCVYDGPMFTAPLHLQGGDVVHRDGFVFADFWEPANEVEKPPRAVMVPFRYGGYWDVPRSIVLRYRKRLLLLDSPFDDALDEYPDVYTVYELSDDVVPSLAVGPWSFRGDTSLRILGTVNIKDVKFDPTRHARLDATILNPLLNA